MSKETSLAIFGIIAAVSLLAGTFVVIEALPIVFAKESGNTNIKSAVSNQLKSLTNKQKAIVSGFDN